MLSGCRCQVVFTLLTYTSSLEYFTYVRNNTLSPTVQRPTRGSINHCYTFVIKETSMFKMDTPNTKRICKDFDIPLNIDDTEKKESMDV